MPSVGSSYPKGPYRFVSREYMIVTYESDPDAIRAHLPEPLQPAAGNLVAYEFMKMPDSSGFGDYCESGVVIPATLNGEEVSFISQMYLDDEPPISCGDTLTGTLDYAGQRVAMGTMTYKHENLLTHYNASDHTSCDPKIIEKKLAKKSCNLKLIPHVDGTLAIAQLVSYHMTDITVIGAWAGPARLHLIPHVNASVADLPVRKILGGSHFIADMTLPYGKVEYDYLTQCK